jgi:hypothetical protein
MPNWSEMDLTQIDLATLPPEQRGELHAEVHRRARIERAQVLRGVVAWVRDWLRGSADSRRHEAQSYAPSQKQPLYFGGRT